MGYGSKRSVILSLPDKIDTARNNRKVSIDACISEVILWLWVKGIDTLGCCCGHNKTNPSVIVSAVVDIDLAFKIIWEIDKRIWTVSRWERIDYTLEYKQ